MLGRRSRWRPQSLFVDDFDLLIDYLPGIDIKNCLG
jgi:hypothetical protein